MPRLTKTSYGVLGMLAMKPWSAYELSNPVRRWLAYCVGPRAERSIYQEGKNLVSLGLARATTVTYGRRSRTEYKITPAGRKALRSWLRQPCEPPVLECEALARTVFAEYGTPADLARTLAELKDQVCAKRDELRHELADYFAQVGVSPTRLRAFPLAGKLYFDYLDLLESWAAWAETEVAGWPDEPEADVDPARVASLMAMFGVSPGQ